jgi:hypothetical protein
MQKQTFVTESVAVNSDAALTPQDWLKVEQLFSEWEALLTPNQIRHILRKRDENGLAKYVAKPAKHLIVNRRGFAQVVTRSA